MTTETEAKPICAEGKVPDGVPPERVHPLEVSPEPEASEKDLLESLEALKAIARAESDIRRKAMRKRRAAHP